MVGLNTLGLPGDSAQAPLWNCHPCITNTDYQACRELGGMARKHKELLLPLCRLTHCSEYQHGLILARGQRQSSVKP